MVRALGKKGTRSVPWAAIAAGGLLLAGAAGVGEEPLAVMRVEEDWQVVLNEPEADLQAPQFHSIMSPVGNSDELHFQVSWNYREELDFAPGGLQLVAWNGEHLLTARDVRSDALSHSAETIRWTQGLRVAEGRLLFEVKNGSSATWGSFGGAEAQLVSPVALANLNGYRPQVSATSSWISYGANRVDELRINEVRWYDGEGRLVARSTTPIVVYARGQ